MSTPTEVTQERALAVTSVNKSYGQLQAVDDVSLEIKPGEIFGLLGPNGAGKSTLINMVAGLTRIDNGKISIFGYDNVRDFQITRRISGVMHQEIVIEKYFALGKALKMHPGFYGVKDDQSWRMELLDRLGLIPHIGKRFVALSGGMKRRFMVAKALVHKPRFLILDEPTAGVDVESRRALWSFVREINAKGTTILLTTHYLEEAEEMCGRIAIMNKGKIVALEDTASLIDKIGDKKITFTLRNPVSSLPTEFEKYSTVLSNEGNALTFDLEHGTQSGEILAMLTKQNLEVKEIETARPDLEDVFLKLTTEGKEAI